MVEGLMYFGVWLVLFGIAGYAVYKAFRAS